MTLFYFHVVVIFFQTSLISFPLFQNETKKAKANWFEQHLNHTVMVNNRYILALINETM